MAPSRMPAATARLAWDTNLSLGTATGGRPGHGTRNAWSWGISSTPGTARTPDRAAVPAVIELRAGEELVHAAPPHTKKRVCDCHDFSDFFPTRYRPGRK